MNLKTHLMFQEGQAREAAEFYATLAEDGEVLSLEETDGVVMAAVRLGGQELVIIDSPIKHEFGMTPAMSLFLEVDSADEVDTAFAALSEDGQVMMPVGEYPFAKSFGWCVDRFGVSWQVRFAG